MKYLAVSIALAALFRVAQVASAEADVQILAIDSALPEDAASAFQDITRNELERGYALRLFKRIEWRYRDRTGSVLLVAANRGKEKNCVAYLVRGDQVHALGGNERCVWAGTPRLVWRGEMAWVEFPRRIVVDNRQPTTSSEMTLHFNKSLGDVCMLGLPSQGFDDLLCADGEAPASR